MLETGCAVVDGDKVLHYRVCLGQSHGYQPQNQTLVLTRQCSTFPAYPAVSGRGSGCDCSWSQLEEGECCKYGNLQQRKKPLMSLPTAGQLA